MKTESANKRLGLPRAKMKQVIIAFDIDGTLISNNDASIYKRMREPDPYPYDTPNHHIVEMLIILSRFKNVKIIVWSGGGKEYAQRWVDRMEINKWVWKVFGKTDFDAPKPDIAIDDIQDTALGDINLIVREK